MVAPQLFPDLESPLQELKPSKRRFPPHATRRRRRIALFRHYSGSARVFLVLAMVLAPVMLYVMLTSRVTSMNYALASAQAEKMHLQGEVQRLDDRIMYLQSPERLAQVAAKLGMKDPSLYAIVTLPAPAQPKPSGLALLGLRLDFTRAR